ncbi:hypothetical protein QAD02_005049 [Eretmocerus hayati]|uniref:Uncharacterized protein n=1 Tax=Eretmocerus hayati TaxID=131215 RepID=A0ACC2NRS9_9HYME|nr:hypothetical protein QAD02_005049 [Eretmocerus hayati]
MHKFIIERQTCQQQAIDDGPVLIKDDVVYHVPSKNMCNGNEAQLNIDLLYPMGKGAIKIGQEEWDCLEEGKCLNDSIIEFYLHHILKSVGDGCYQTRTHIFPTHFFTKLIAPGKTPMGVSNQCSASIRHANVSRWTKHINIFQKQFIVIPVCLSGHWFVVIVCHPSYVGPVKAATEFTGRANLKRPAILLFDSINGRNKEAVADVIRGYLACEYAAKYGKTKHFTSEILPGVYADVPQQNNGVDCGVFLLEYVERFFTDDRACTLDHIRSWFTVGDIRRKRTTIRGLIQVLANARHVLN